MAALAATSNNSNQHSQRFKRGNALRIYFFGGLVEAAYTQRLYDALDNGLKMAGRQAQSR